jgi:ATP-dependent Clp protease ATP-binding subunit ClpC
MRHLRESMAERELQIELSEGSKDFLVEKGWDPAMGARPLRRAIQRYIEDPLADEVLKTPMTPGSTVLVERHDDERHKDKADVGDEELKITILAPVEKPPEEQPVPVGGSDEGDQPSDDAGDSGDAGEQPEQPSEN